MESYFISCFPAIGTRSQIKWVNQLNSGHDQPQKPPHEGTQLFFLLFEQNYDGTNPGGLAANLGGEKDREGRLWSLEQVFGETQICFHPRSWAAAESMSCLSYSKLSSNHCPLARG